MERVQRSRLVEEPERGTATGEALNPEDRRKRQFKPERWRGLSPKRSSRVDRKRYMDAERRLKENRFETRDFELRDPRNLLLNNKEGDLTNVRWCFGGSRMPVAGRSL